MLYVNVWEKKKKKKKKGQWAHFQTISNDHTEIFCKVLKEHSFLKNY